MTGSALSSSPGLVGRAAEVAELGRLVAAGPLVTVVGPPGVGKSRLVAEFAASWPGPVAPLGEAEPPPGAGPLFTVDDCDHDHVRVLDLAARTLAGRPDARVLLSSRERLGGEHEATLRLGPLDEVAAERLFLLRARAAGAQLRADTSPTIAEICHRLDRLPLSIGLAAARTAVLTPAQILDRLDAPFRLLGGGRTGPERHRSLRAALDWSLPLLPAPARRLLRRLAVFEDGFLLADVESVCADDELTEDDVLDALVLLAGKSLVDTDTSAPDARYQLLRTVRQYAAALLAEAGETAAISARHADHYAGLAERCTTPVWSGDVSGLSQLDAAEANLTAAALFLDRTDPSAAGRLAAAMIPFWLVRGRLREGLDTVQALPPDDSPAGRRARVGAGLFACLLGEVDAALAAVRAVSDLADVPATDRLLALTVRSAVSALTGTVGDGAEPDPSDAPLTGLRLALHAVALSVAGDLDAARAAAERAVADADAPLDREVALLAAGHVRRRTGALPGARAALREAVDIARVLDERCGLTIGHRELAELAATEGNYDDAARTDLRIAVAGAIQVDSPLLLIPCLDLLGRMRLAERADDEARTFFVRSLDLSRKTTHRQAASALLGLAELARRGGRSGPASTLVDEVGVIAREDGGRALLADAFHATGDLARHDGEPARAAAAYRQALVLRAQAGLAVDAVRAIEELARATAAQDKPTDAVRLFAAADAQRAAMGALRRPADEAAITAARVTVAAGLTEDDRAAAVAQGAALSLSDVVSLVDRRCGPRHPGVGWVSLTKAERSVAALVADGLTNRETAQRLFVSPRTVQAHLSHVFAKLGVRSRQELAQEFRSRTSVLRNEPR